MNETPAQGPLASDELDGFRSRLLRRGEGLAARLAEILAGKEVDLVALALPTPEPGERPEDRLRRFLRRVDEALARIRAGTYGACVDCGRFPGKAFFDEVPWADRCPGCEELAVRHGPGPQPPVTTPRTWTETPGACGARSCWASSGGAGTRSVPRRPPTARFPRG